MYNISFVKFLLGLGFEVKFMEPITLLHIIDGWIKNRGENRRKKEDNLAHWL